MGILNRLFAGRAEPSVPFAPPVPTRLTYAVGDVHGAARLLERLLEKIDADTVARDADDADLVLVGDYVDRGDDSRAVLDMIRALACESPDMVTCLMGNHERMLLNFLDSPVKAGPRWLRYGGLQTLASFGIGGVTERSDGPALEEVRDRLAEAMGPDLMAWLRTLPLVWQSGDLAIVHAAADPALAIDEQPSQVLLWGHPEFERTPRRDGVWVVHGHTVVGEAGYRAGRVSVDTGACFTGRLTAAVIAPGAEPVFLAA